MCCAPGDAPRPPTERKLIRLSRARCHPDPDQPRKEIDQQKLMELADSLRTFGQQLPGIAYWHPTIPGDVVLIDAHRRWMALGLVPCDEIELIVLSERPTQTHLRAIQVSLGVTSEKLNPIDLATAAIQLASELGITYAEVAAQIGCSASKLSKCISIADKAAPQLRPEIEAGVIPFSSAAALARLPDHAKQIELAEKIKAGLLKREAVETEVQRLLNSGKKASKRKPVKVANKFLAMNILGDDLNALLDELNKIAKAVKRCIELKLPPDSIPPSRPART
jgi:ParB family transcriptional regulator, chromosome partitioning protein